MASKNRIYRILEIIILMNDKYKKWRIKELADHFAVSPRTIYRDFKIMDSINIPICNDEKAHTYTILDNYYFRPPDITEKEAVALLMMKKAFKEVFPYQEGLNTAIAKILNSLPESIKKVVDNIGTEIIYQHGAVVNYKEYKDVIQEIEKAISNHNSLIINYYTMSRDQTGERKIDPYKIAYKNGACYLIAYCHNRHDILMFRVDRIKDIKTTDEIFKKSENFDIDKYLENSWGIERGDITWRVVLEFKGKAAILVREKEWHPSQQIINLRDGRIRFEVTTSSMEEIKSWVLSYGSDVKVIEPQELIKKIDEEIKKMQEIYK